MERFPILFLPDLEIVALVQRQTKGNGQLDGYAIELRLKVCYGLAKIFGSFVVLIFANRESPMSTKSEEEAQIANALNNLAAAMERLQDRYDLAQRANRRARVALFFAALMILGGVGYWALKPFSRMLSVVAPHTLANRDLEAGEAERMHLKELLPPQKRAQVEEFEQEVKWVHDYLKAFPDFDAGASITLFLAQMSYSVQVMPAMYAEVRSMKQEMQTINKEMSLMNAKMSSLPVLAHDVKGMNVKMDALPILATDVQGMHVQMGVMATGMDSTMGRAGRMMPWNW